MESKNIAPEKDYYFFQPKSIDIFHISPCKLILYYALGASNEYPQHVFMEK